jgi:ferredoxin
MSIALPYFGILLCLFFLTACITSLFEKERRPAVIFLFIGLLIPCPYLIPSFSILVYPAWLTSILILIPLMSATILFIPFRGNVRYVRQNPGRRFDERDTMFSRRTLVPGTPRFEDYYNRNPEKKVPDNQFRRKPGLLKAGSAYYDPILFAAAGSLFDRVDELQSRVEGEPAGKITDAEPQVMSDAILGMIRNWGAHSAGITELKETHVYSTGGRGDRYGEEFRVEHKYAIAFTVEMDYALMRTAPAAPTLVESARQYLQSGTIAVQVAEFIRGLGYPARAHIDANYKVICPLVARDAGLGEIGRMGLLMTPRLGPRCRIAVITTDIPLITTPAEPDKTVIDFCRRCNKCALACPSRSIPLGPEKDIEGSRRWKISSEGCYTYWCHAGTDCGRCMIVCPHSHPDNWFHNFIRYSIRNSFLFRRIAIKMDDLVYGRIPKPGGMKT